MPTTLPLYQVDAFTSTMFHGNPAAICPLDTWLPEATMQKIALENNLSETAFFVKEGEVYHIRWFTPTVEIALCGHATVATAHVMIEHLGIRANPIHFTCMSGPISVKKKEDVYFLDFPSQELTAAPHQDSLTQALGAIAQKTYRGTHAYFLVFEEEQQIRNFEPDWNMLLKADMPGICVTAPGKDCDFVSRFFAPAKGINEDPVTGSAHTGLIPYWSKRLKKETLLAKQISSRGGLLYCKNHGKRVEIGGNAITYLEGTIRF
jgi:PhzF family phenazine biosynthesis protein